MVIATTKRMLVADAVEALAAGGEELWVGVDDKGASRLAEALRLNRSVTRLHLENSCLDTKGLPVVLPALEEHNNLRCLSVQLSCAEDARYLGGPLRANDGLLELDVRGVQGGLVEELAKALKNHPRLTRLGLAHNDLGGDGARHLSGALACNQQLTHLELQHSRLGQEGALCLAEALKVNRSLTRLNLQFTELDSEGAGHLAEALKVNSGLTHLTLSSNDFYPEGACHLAKALMTNTSLTHLLFCGAKIGDEGCMHLAAALMVNRSLTELDLRNNRVESEGAGHLAEALKTNSSLRRLDLGSNELESEGARQLAAALPLNASLTQLDLWNTELNDEDARHFAEALPLNRHLVVLGGLGWSAASEEMLPSRQVFCPKGCGASLRWPEVQPHQELCLGARRVLQVHLEGSFFICRNLGGEAVARLEVGDAPRTAGEFLQALAGQLGCPAEHYALACPGGLLDSHALLLESLVPLGEALAETVP